MEKEKLRKKLKRQIIPLLESIDRNRTINNQIKNMVELYHSCLLYYPLHREVDLMPIGKEVLRQRGKLYFPVITGENTMDFYQVNDLNTKNWERVRGILQPLPKGEKYQSHSLVDTLFIPGMGFNRLGYRIGYGSGFFDRWLPSFKGKTYGVCFNTLMTNELIPEKHDVPVDYIITENEFFSSYKNRIEIWNNNHRDIINETD